MNSHFLISESAPLQILFVEDNEVNRFYIAKQTSVFSDTIEFVENGRQAVSKANTTVYDLIFMDIYLPVMDGYQAAQKIRLLPPPYCHPPIIGITNAEGPNKQTHSGINDFISKFFDVEEFQDKVQKWVKAKDSLPVMTLPEHSPLLKIKDVNSKKQMMEVFLKQKTEFILGMDIKIETGQMGEIFFIVHKMKSTVELLGIAELKLLFAEMERDAKEKNKSGIEKNYSRVKNLFNEYFPV